MSVAWGCLGRIAVTHTAFASGRTTQKMLPMGLRWVNPPPLPLKISPEGTSLITRIMPNQLVITLISTVESQVH